MATKANSFMGIASGTTITQGSGGNSGGASGTFFDTVSGTVTADTAADITFAYDRGMLPVLSASTNSYVAWNLTSGSTGYFRFYFRVKALPVASIRVARGMNGATMEWEVRLTSTGYLGLYTAAGALLYQTQASAFATNTIYRVEVGVTASTGEMRVYAAESTTPLTLDTFNSAPTYATPAFTEVRFGLNTTAAQTISGVGLAALAYSDVDWIGPAAYVPEWTTINKRIVIS